MRIRTGLGTLLAVVTIVGGGLAVQRLFAAKTVLSTQD